MAEPERILAAFDEVLIKRFWSYVRRADGDSCWLWTGGFFDTGYGSFWDRQRNLGAHIFSWFLHYGLVPTGKLVMHKCDERACVRPDHLVAGTQQDNIKDMWAKRRAGWQKKQPRHLRGSEHTQSKLTEEKVQFVRRVHATGYSAVDIAWLLDVCADTIYKVLQGRQWTHVQ